MTFITTAGWVAQAVKWAVLHGDADTGIARVCTDARKTEPGDLFVGLRGERFDGTDFAADAAARGASAVMVSRLIEGINAVQIVVPDVNQAFCESAAAWRQRFSIPVISVSGSNGKTTTTQMIASILREAYGRDGYLSTEGNFNNSVGVPITLWRLRDGMKAAVVESGMSHRGEMAELAAMIRPTVAVITNAQREHQEFLPSVEATAEENADSIKALPADGVAVYPADDACAPIWEKASEHCRRRTYATQPGVSADLTAEVMTLGGTTEVRIHAAEGSAMTRLDIGGAHNGHNAAAAAAAAFSAGVKFDAVIQGLQAFKPVARRGVRHQLRPELLLIDDTYNANPDSMRAGIDVLTSSRGPLVLIAGDMGEVGTRGAEFHQEIGLYAKEKDVGTLLACGDLMQNACSAFGSGARHYADLDTLCREAAETVRGMEAGTVLVKASNFMHFDRVVKAVLEALSDAAVSE